MHPENESLYQDIKINANLYRANSDLVKDKDSLAPNLLSRVD